MHNLRSKNKLQKKENEDNYQAEMKKKNKNEGFNKKKVHLPDVKEKIGNKVSSPFKRVQDSFHLPCLGIGSNNYMYQELNEEDEDDKKAKLRSQRNISTTKTIKNEQNQEEVVSRQVTYTIKTDFVEEEIYGDRFRFDGNHESNQFTFIERKRYRKMVKEMKNMGLKRMLTVLGPQGFHF